ncbi:MAG: DUF4270 family protein [Chitinophagaceae bacterium]
MNLRIVFILLLSFVFVSSCRKQDDNVFLENETTTGFDGYSSTDTLMVQTSTVREDSLKTDSLSHNLIGVINDPVFGKYQASTYFQLKLPQVGNVISTNTLDSAVLFLQFTSSTAYYGDLNSEISFNVYELTESMGSSVTHSNQSYAYDNTPIGTFTGKYHVSDSLAYTSLGTTYKGAPGISIKLSSAFAQKMFNATSNDLSSQANFLNFLKGLVLVPANTPPSGSGAIAAINLKGAFTRLRVYYNGNMQSDFKVFDDCERFSSYSINNQGSEITGQKSFNGTANFDTTYVMAMSGAKTYIKLPELFNIVPNNGKLISVGKAEIVFRPLAGTYNAPFTLPKRMLLFVKDKETGLNAGMIDMLEPFYGGTYNASKNEYRFNITRYIQSLYTDYQLKGTNNNLGLFLAIPSDSPVSPSRIMIDASKGNAGSGIEFKLIYTEL